MGRNVTALLPRLGTQHEYLMLVPAGRGYEEHAGNPCVKVQPIERMGKAARQYYLENRTPEQMVNGFVSAIEYALNK